MVRSVAILGGGIAGLSAAHELIQRGFDVTVYEVGTRADLGGKAANQPLVRTGVDGRADLPGEHGFRFYPGFYRHLVATMFEIPGLAGYVSDDLRASDETGVLFAGQPLMRFPRRLDGSAFHLLDVLRTVHGDRGVATAEDVALMAWFRLKYLTTCHRRREAAYDGKTWSEFLELDGAPYSDMFRRFERAIPRTLSAMVADECSAFVIGDITMQMVLGYARPTEPPDRVLAGPTGVRWLEPWVDHLERAGVRFVTGVRVERLDFTGSDSRLRVTGVELLRPDTGERAHCYADFYVAALPLEAMRSLATASGMAGGHDPGIDGLLHEKLDPARSTDWMVGAQFFLRRDVPICRGHVMYPDSDWALTSVSPVQFWRQGGADPTRFGDGRVTGVLTVAISDWRRPSTQLGRPARTAGMVDPARARDIVLDEVTRQLRAAFKSLAGADPLAPGNVVHRHLDRNLRFDPSGVAENATPLLIHPRGSWRYRPEARLEAFTNLVLASDYVRTDTKLATMEGANEAARRAVNAILDVAQSDEPECVLWPLVEELFVEARALDERRWLHGLPHVMDGERPSVDALPGLLRDLHDTLLTDPWSLLP